MNDENINQLCAELDKLKDYIGDNKVLTSDYLEHEYEGVVSMRDLGKPSYRNEYRIIKTIIDARTKVLIRYKDKLPLFVPASKIIKSIEEQLKDIYN
jgi:hypothetical protein